MNSPAASKRPLDSQPTMIVALTGGIASGKTAASDHFSSLGVPVIDTDLVAREVVEPGSEVLEEIARLFGKQYLKADGSMDRRRIRSLIMQDDEKRQELESIIHPAITRETLRQIALVSAPYCVVVVPLLVGSKLLDAVDRVLLVDVSEETQILRLMERDAVTKEEALNSLRAQASRADRLAIADDVVSNEGSLSELLEQVDKLHLSYTQASHH